MKWEINENSLFVVLLRSPWWVSVLIAIAIAAALRIFLPLEFAIFGGLPFGVIARGGLAAVQAARGEAHRGDVERARALRRTRSAPLVKKATGARATRRSAARARRTWSSRSAES